MLSNSSTNLPTLEIKLESMHSSRYFFSLPINLGYEPFLCENEEEARKLAKVLPKDGFYPCLFAPSDTTGEKDTRSFSLDGEKLDMQRLQNIGIVKNECKF